MNNLFAYLVELNIALVILYVAYKLFFEKDKNFLIRRIYLMSAIVLPFILPLIPEAARMSVSGITPVSIDLEGITVFGSGAAQETSGTISFGKIMLTGYLLILALGLIKLMIQLVTITRAIFISKQLEIDGTTLLSNSTFHASSFFGYIFIDPASIKDNSFHHILEHEKIHKREWHSVDRILVELFVMINWFNPFAWMFRNSVIQNLEYLADSAMVRKGTDPMKYQLSILNQYIGSASISNQFSSQIKNRIIMLNKDYKLGSSWKLFLLLPFVMIALFAISCSDNESTELSDIPGGVQYTDEDGKTYYQIEEMPKYKGESQAGEELFYIVEEMPAFNEGEAAIEFRKYLAQNLRYPEIAIQDSISGRVIVQFAVNSEGKVVDAVVVRSVSPALDKEAIRVVMSSPEWIPGKQRGKTVKVLYTFPINFVIQ